MNHVTAMQELARSMPGLSASPEETAEWYVRKAELHVALANDAEHPGCGAEPRPSEWSTELGHAAAALTRAAQLAGQRVVSTPPVR